MKTETSNHCMLCQGEGCIAKLLGRKPPEGKPLPETIMIFIYGLPVLGLLSGGSLGALLGEFASIMGAGLGLISSLICLRACQPALNRLSLRTLKQSGESCHD